MQLIKTDIEQISSVKYFQGLTQGELIEVVKAAEQRKYDSGKFVFFEADPAVSMYVLLEGQIKLTQLTPEGKQVILGFVSPGSAFGIIAVLGDLDYPVSAQAVVHSRMMRWEKEIMHELMIQIPNLSLNGLRILSNKIQEFQDRIRELSTERVERRIARALIRLARQIGQQSPEGVVIEMPITRQDLGEMTGTTLYTVSRTLSKWESMGILISSRERVTIRSPHKLVVIAEDITQS